MRTSDFASPGSVLSVTVALAAALCTAACGPGTEGSGGSAGTTLSTGGNGTGAGGPGGTGGVGGIVGDDTPGPIADCPDAPGECPPGLPKVEITNAAELASASRGEDAYAGDAPATCYFLHNGNYDQSGVVFYVKVGGEPDGNHRVFVGESRSGVVIHGRGSLDDGVGSVTVQNLTFDLTGYSQAGSFNTLTLGNGSDIQVDHVTFTGDCKTGLKGGHIETNDTSHVLVECCTIEKFGHCGAGGHEDHGVYLASGSDITLRNNTIRQNSSRGVQMYTQGGEYGTLQQVLVERNLFLENGHGDYEDGIVLNAYGTGNISFVTIRRNVFFHNYYSGIRFAGGLFSGVFVARNTFVQNGAGSALPGRSEINLDDAGGGAATALMKNLFEVGNTLINDCYDAASLGFGFSANFVHGTIPTGAQGNCVGSVTTGDPQLTGVASGDYHPQNPVAQAFGVYAP